MEFIRLALTKIIRNFKDFYFTKPMDFSLISAILRVLIFIVWKQDLYTNIYNNNNDSHHTYKQYQVYLI